MDMDFFAKNFPPTKTELRKEISQIGLAVPEEIQTYKQPITFRNYKILFFNIFIKTFNIFNLNKQPLSLQSIRVCVKKFYHEYSSKSFYFPLFGNVRHCKFL